MAEENKDGLVLAAIIVVSLVGYAIWKSQQPVVAHYHGTFGLAGEIPPSTPEYMRGDAEIPEYAQSTDDRGGTLYYEEGAISRMAGHVQGPGQNYHHE